MPSLLHPECSDCNDDWCDTGYCRECGTPYCVQHEANTHCDAYRDSLNVGCGEPLALVDAPDEREVA
ncbi:MAG: hypothetical protein IT379_37315 [Deltaproteobacteria bacterium]|nr:hypothetical protein [Deltaproteobacteria bacterium]